MAGRRIAVVGTGANGASIGADLTRAGLDVSFIDQWPAHVEAMRANGIRIETPEGAETTKVHAFHVCDVTTLREPFDIVMVITKAYDTRWACELIKPLLKSDGLAIGVQNGMTMDDMASIMGPERTLGAVIEVSSNMFVPGVVERQTPRSGSWFAVGGFDERTQGRAQEIVDVLGHAGTVEISKDIRSSKWMKLVLNAAEFLPSAILNLPLADAVDVPGIRDIMVAAGREAIHTGLAVGRQIMPILGQKRVDANDPDRYTTDLFDTLLNGWTLPTTKVAVLQDWMKGRRGEVDDINGLVVDACKTLGRKAPVNAMLVDLAHRIEAGEMKADPANAELLRTLFRQ